METLAFQTRHDYAAARAGIEVPISLAVGGARPVRLRANFDTGASFCIFQRQYAEQLGIDVENGQHQNVRTAAGVGFSVYGHVVSLSCLDWEFETMVYFAVAHEFTRNVVGRSGWLQHFSVRSNRPRRGALSEPL
ncbi:MAG: retropepsin-like aspartic protease [Bryobacteraceae bacterium]|jgi:hypothetical protein